MESRDPLYRYAAQLAAESGLPLTVAIFYASVPAASRAAGLVNRLAERFQDEFEVETNLWSFDVLQLAEVRDFASARTAEADLLVVSTQRHDIVPVQVRECIENAMARRDEKSLALIALVEGSTHPVEHHDTCTYLKQLCRREEHSFFSTHESPLDRPNLTPQRVRERAKSTSSLLNGFLERRLPIDPFGPGR